MKLTQKNKDNLAYCALTALTIYLTVDLMLLFSIFPYSLIAPERQLELVTLFRLPNMSIELYRSLLFKNYTSAPMILVLAIIFRDIIRYYLKK